MKNPRAGPGPGFVHGCGYGDADGFGAAAVRRAVAEPHPWGVPVPV